MTGTGNAPRTGSVSSTTAGMCSDYQASCNTSNNAPDMVYWFQSDIDGMLQVNISGASFTPAIYVEMLCNDVTTEVACTKTSSVSAQVVANLPYYIIVDGTTSSGSGAFTLDVAVKPPMCGDSIKQPGEECDDGNTDNGDGCDSTCKLEPPGPNDVCPGVAITLTGTGTSPRTGSVMGNTSTANADYSASCGGTTNKDVVYSFSSDVAGTAVIDLGGATFTPFDAVLYARSACTDTTTQMGCNDAIGNGADKITFAAAANTTYYVFVDGYGTSNMGPFKLNIAVTPPACGNGILEPPEACDDGNLNDGDGCDSTCVLEPAGPHDTCPGVTITLTGTGTDPRIGTATGMTTNAMADYTGSCTSSSGAGRDVVYSFTSDVSGAATVDLGNATVTPFDAVLYARKDCLVASSEVGCNDAATKGADKITFAALANTTYYVIVDGYGATNFGNYQVNVKIVPPVCGNGTKELPEECDDGNQNDNDGCSALCTFEPVGGPEDVCPGVPVTLAASGMVLTATVTGSTVGLASNYAGTCGSSGTAKDAVFMFNSGPGGNTEVILTANVTTFDSVLYVRKDSCSAGVQLGCSDKVGNGGDVVTFNAAANTDYWVFVDGYSGKSGDYELKITVAPPVCGNGTLEGSEECDDGNTTDGDGCDATCVWEAECGAVTEVEPNPYDNPQVIPQACGSFKIMGASLPAGDVDFYRVTMLGGSTLDAWTFVGNPGQCGTGNDTVLSLFKSPITTPGNPSGGCTGGYLTGQCNDTDSTNSPCSRIGPYVVSNAQAGEYVLKVHNYSSSTPINSYGLLVVIK